MTDIDQNWAWFVLLGAVVANLLSGGIIYSYGVLYNDIRDRLESSSAETAAVGAVCLACFFFVVPFGRYLSRLIGYRWTTIIGSLVQAVGLVVSAFVPTVHLYLLTLGLLAGCGGGLVYAACFVAIEDYFDKKLLLATGLVHCGPPFGVFLFAIIILELLNAYAYYGTFILLCALMLNGIVCGVIFKPLGKRDKTASVGKYTRMADETGGDQGEPGSDVPRVAATGDQYSDKDEDEDEEDDENTGFGKVKKTRYKAAEETVESFTFSADESSFKMPSHGYTDEIEEYESDVEEPPTSADKPNRNKPDVHEMDVEPSPSTSEGEPEPEPVKETPKDFVSAVFGTKNMRSLCQCDFVIFLVAVGLFSTGFSTPYFLFPDFLRERGGDENQAAGILSSIGVAALAGVGLFWFLAWKLEPGYARTSVLIAVTTTCVSGLTIAFIRYYYVLFFMMFSAVGFGFLSAVFHPLKQKMIVTLWGDASRLGSLTLTYWVAALGSILGSPIAGYLRDSHATYAWSFVMAAACLCTCALVALPLLFVGRERQKYVRDAI